MPICFQAALVAFCQEKSVTEKYGSVPSHSESWGRISAPAVWVPRSVGLPPQLVQTKEGQSNH